MPRHRNETAEEYYIRAKNEAREAHDALVKEQRAKRNELIKKVGKLFVEKCKKESFVYYAGICESEAFANFLSAFNSTEAEANTAAETDRENNSVVEANVGAAVETNSVV